MKKLIFISLLTLFVFEEYSQVISPDEYLKEAYRNNILSLTLSPHKLGLGISYTSKPIIELNRPISFLSSIELGYYDEGYDKPLRLIKFNIGGSIVIKNFNLSISPSFNFTKQESERAIFEPITFEIGGMTKVNKIYWSIFIDPIELETKIGIGFGF